MIASKHAHTLAFGHATDTTHNTVQQEELSAIGERRAAAGIDNHRDFTDLDTTVGQTITQRHLSPAFQEVLRKLNDEEQNQRWHAYAEQHQPQAANLTGLAFSGGGIRSATFNLGVLQVLAWTGVLKFVDYLSTVSGGGYLGATLSSWCGSSGRNQPHSFPFDHSPGQIESPVFRHLRNNAEYLAPAGAVDYLRIPMTVIRGMAINLLVILPYLVLAALLTKLVHPTVESLQHDWIIEHFGAWVPAFLGRHLVFTKALLLLILASFALFPVAYMFLQETRWLDLSNWQVRNRAGRLYAALLLLTAVVAFVELQPIVLRWLLVDRKLAIQQWAATVTTVQSLLPVALSAWLIKNASKLAGKYVLSLLGLSALLAFWLIELAIAAHLIEGAQYTLTWSGLWPPVVIMLALFLYAFLFVDVNYTSVHAFYRDRLSKAYLIKPGDSIKQPLRPNDKQLLSTLNTAHCPYHLINTAINLSSSTEAYRKGRYADSFIFSPRFVGSELTGYCRTRHMESQTRHLNLGTAMAISGAAAAPNMGKQTNRLLAFFLAMLNVRLNYWLPNPRHATPRANRQLPRNPLQRVGPLYLLRELFGWVSAESLNVSLSDGGHFDNLGLYELFRRQCRFIICGDGEADPKLQLNGLAEALRMVQVDMGILIQMQGLDAIRAGTQHHAIGRIRYADGREGWLLYLKQSFYEGYDQGPFIAEYKQCCPDFPHQSTANQFFDEAQFECTRAQGYNVAYRTLCI